LTPEVVVLKRLIVFFVIVASLFTVFSGCSRQTASATLVLVGSKIDTEGALLAQMIISVLNYNSITTTDKSGTGPTSVVRKAIIAGDIDIYPEYTGNGAFFFNETGLDIWNNAQKGYKEVEGLDKAANNIIWLTSAPANNTWAVAVTKKLADQQNLKTLVDFAKYINSGGTVKLIGSDEFITSPVAFPAFQKAYGFTLTKDQLIVVSSGDTAQTEKAAADGANGVNAAMAYGTDGALAAFGLVVLGDPKGAQPVYEPAPIIRGAVLDKYPQISSILAPIFESLDLTTLQSLNAKIAVDGQSAAAVARSYLLSKGFIK
jgi:osmoprotectant transport system substrate-binding protein